MGRPTGPSGRDPARLGIHLQDLFNRFRMTVRSFNKSLLNNPWDVVEGDRPLQKRGYGHLVSGIEGNRLGSTQCSGFVSKAQAGELVEMGAAKSNLFRSSTLNFRSLSMRSG